MNETIQRKKEHLDVVLNENVSMTRTANGFDSVCFEHVALPELNLDAINLTAKFLNKQLKAPLLISSMTGGAESARRINTNLAIAAEALGIAFGVGSQRVALENGSCIGFDRDLRQIAPSVPILANFGAAQLAQWDGAEMAQRAVDMINADALIIHLNPLQEAIQAEGDRDWRGILGKIEQIASKVSFPIVCKEVGSGLSGVVARRLCDAGVAVIDVAGAGGTSWAAVEGHRSTDPQRGELANIFKDWGIPTADALSDVRAHCPDVTLIASGGVRHGLDVAKALRLGADLVGQAAGVLPAALASAEAVIEHFTQITDALKITCFCTGSATIADLRKARLLEAPYAN